MRGHGATSLNRPRNAPKWHRLQPVKVESSGDELDFPSIIFHFSFTISIVTLLVHVTVTPRVSVSPCPRVPGIGK